MKILDGYVLFEENSAQWTKTPNNVQREAQHEEHSTRWTKTPKNVHTESQHISLFVITSVISRHSCKISRECFKFLKTLSNILKIGLKILHIAPRRGIRVAKFFLVHWL